MTVTFRSFQTSAAIVKRTRWQIKIKWIPLDEDGAKTFIINNPPRDKRNLMEKNRFRMLLVQCTDFTDYDKQEELLRVAKLYGWVHDQFNFLVKNRTGGAAVSESVDGISLAVQVLTDHGHPFFSISLTNRYIDGRQRDTDWLCLFFAGPTLARDTLELIITEDPFPSDYYPPISPDFMFLPASLLRWQVKQTTDGLKAIKEDILQHDKQFDKQFESEMAQEPQDIRKTLPQIRQNHLMLNGRCLVIHDFATKMNDCFQMIEKWNSRGEEIATYSASLRYKVQTETANLMTLRRDLDTTASRMQAQQTMLDNRISLILTRNSEIATEQARRDGASMKTIAIVTLVFLPGAFVATIFSMSIFDWEEKKESRGSVASKWIWLYFAITVPLTIIVIYLWKIWYRREEKKYYQKWDKKVP